MNKKEFEGIVENQDPVVYCLSHIARQLTIANEYRESELTVGRAIVEQIERIANVFEARVAFQEKPASPDDKFIELPDEKGNVHHFHRHDLESYRDGYFFYKSQGGFKTILSAKDMEVLWGLPLPLPPMRWWIS